MEMAVGSVAAVGGTSRRIHKLTVGIRQVFKQTGVNGYGDMCLFYNLCRVLFLYNFAMHLMQM